MEGVFFFFYFIIAIFNLGKVGMATEGVVIISNIINTAGLGSFKLAFVRYRKNHF